MRDVTLVLALILGDYRGVLALFDAFLQGGTMVLGRNVRQTKQRLSYASALLCSLAACGTDDRPPTAGGPDMDFSPSVTEDAGEQGGDAGVRRDGGRDAAAPGADAEEPVLPDNPPADDPTTERLVVSDATAAKLYVLDARDFTLVAELDAAPGSRVTAGPAGRHAFVHAAQADGVQVLDVGLSVVSQQGAAPRTVASEPTFLDAQIPGAGPRSLVVGAQSLAVSFARVPRAVFFDERALPDGLDEHVIDTGDVHDGVAFALGELELVSHREQGEDGWALRAADPTLSVSVPDCADPDLAGVIGDVGAVGCAGGVAYLSVGAGGALSSAFHAFDVADQRATQVATNPKSGAFAFLVENAVQLVTAQGSTSYALTERPVALAFTAQGKQLWVLLASGKLAILDSALSPDVLPDLVETGCVTADRDPLPHLHFGRTSAYLTCPVRGEIHELQPGTGLSGAVHQVGDAPLDLQSFTF